LLASDPSEFGTIEVLWISFMLTLFVTGIFAFIGFAYPSSRILPEGYYTIKNPQALTQICAAMGVKYFRFLLLFTFWGTEKNRKKYFNGTKKGITNFLYQTHQSEFGHLAAFLVIGIISILLLTHGYFFLVLIVTLINIVGNVYPVLLQRHHRIRIEKVKNYS
jgi:hypothetical protein